MISLVKRLDSFLAKEVGDKKVFATVVLLAADHEKEAPKLQEVAKDAKLEHVPLTVADDGEAGPEPYKLNKDVTFTLVVYGKGKKVTATFALDKLDDKANDAAVDALKKVADVK